MRWKRWFAWVSALVVVGTAIAAVVGFVALDRIERDLPDVHELSVYKPPQVTRVLARDGSTLAELFTERRTVVSIAELPAHVKLAFVAAEDAYFYEHEGVNYGGMVRAFLVNLRAGRTRQGASTITQQVVKNLLLDPERTYKRKVREVLLARRLEQDLNKDQILELYLNAIYFGGGRYGVEEAAKYYFGKSAKELTIGEAAVLGGLPKGPEIYSPRNNLAASLERRRFVLAQMEKKGFLTAEQAQAAAEEPLRLAAPNEAQAGLAPEVVEAARRTLKELVGEGYVRGGYTVMTTIDPRLQALARKAVRDNLQALDKRTKAVAPFKKAPAPVASKRGKGAAEERPYEGVPKANELHRSFLGVVTATHDEANTLEVRVGDVPGVVRLGDFERYNPAHLSAGQFAEVGAVLRVSFLAPPPQVSAEGAPQANKPAPPVPLRLELGAESALVAIDPASRDVLALIGSYEGAAGALDRATQSRRQPGSTFKPVLYSYALHSHKVTAATLIDAGQTTQSAYKNVNHEDGAFTQPVRLREGLAKSINPVALQVMREVGPEHVVPWARELGITGKLGADLSLALGAYEVAPIEMAGAYATFAAGGVYEAPRLITKVIGPGDKEIVLAARPPARRVMDENESYLMTNLLTSVVDHGTGARAKELGRPVAGKTGTTNQAKDAWFVGYSPDLVCAVWSGDDDPRPLGGGKEAGATAALPAWLAFMKGALEGRPVTDFPRPGGLSVVKIDPATGKRAWEGEEGAIDEIFLPGTEPTDTADPNAAGSAAPASAAVPAMPGGSTLAPLPPLPAPSPAAP